MSEHSPKPSLVGTDATVVNDTGLREVDWEGPDDPANPRNWSDAKSNLHVILISLGSLYGNLAATMYAPGAAQLVTEFGIESSVVAAFTVSIYMLGLAVGPLFIAPLSEHYGRLIVIHACNLVFVAFLLACALSASTGTFLAFRFISAMGCSGPIAIGGGVIADITTAEKRAKSLAIWAAGPVLGPVIGPVVGGFASQNLGWRWTFYLLTILAGITSLVELALLRESNGAVLLQRKAKKLRKETGDPQIVARGSTGQIPRQLLARAVIRPMRLLIFSPIVLLLSLYFAFIFSLMILLFTTFPAVFGRQYGFSIQIAGLSYLGIGVGLILALVVFSATSTKVLQRLKGDKEATPEMRLPLMIVFAPLIPVGFFWYGWSAQAQTHWIVPILGTLFIGFGSLFVMMPTQIYLVDAFGPEAAASAVAASTMLRTVASAFITLAGPPLYAKFGLGWGNSLLAFICVLFLPMPVIFYRHGKALRERFVFLP